MSITSDLKTYADSAVSQGKQVIDQSIALAQAQLTEATDAVHDVCTSAEKVINVDALRSTVEPYLDQARPYVDQALGYGTFVTDRVNDVYDTLKSDPRVGRAIGTAEAMTGLLALQVQEHIVKPVVALTGLGAKPAATSTSTTTTTTTPTTTAKAATPKNASTTRRPAAKAATPKPTTARTTTTRTSTARKASTKSAPAKATPQS